MMTCLLGYLWRISDYPKYIDRGDTFIVTKKELNYKIVPENLPPYPARYIFFADETKLISC